MDQQCKIIPNTYTTSKRIPAIYVLTFCLPPLLNIIFFAFYINQNPAHGNVSAPGTLIIVTSLLLCSHIKAHQSLHAHFILLLPPPITPSSQKISSLLSAPRGTKFENKYESRVTGHFISISPPPQRESEPWLQDLSDESKIGIGLRCVFGEGMISHVINARVLQNLFLNFYFSTSLG